MADSQSSNLHILMFPWLATGHFTPFLHLSNELASRGHRITFLLPKKASILLKNLNLYPNLISFKILTVPHVSGLPPSTETASDIPLSLNHLLSIAFDLTRPQVEEIIQFSLPDFVFYDFAFWVPEITAKYGLKSISYIVVSAASIAITLTQDRTVNCKGPEYPSDTVVLTGNEADSLRFLSTPFGEGITFLQRLTMVLERSDAIAMRTCEELEGEFCGYLGQKFEKRVLLTGPVLSSETTSTSNLDEKWEKWLDGFEAKTVIFCALGSQIILEKDQFHELLMAFEECGQPFLAALKPPMGFESIEEALPEGFRERVGERGVVHGGWIQQPLILNHESVGCFVSHCGFGSMWESLMSDCQIVLVPHLGDQILNAKLLVKKMKVAAMAEREENGRFTKESVREAIDLVMGRNEFGEMVKKNHAKWKRILTEPGFMKGYIDKFVEELQQWRERGD